jgi:ribonuclease VapC
VIVVDTSALFAFLAAEPESEALAGRMQVEPVLVSAPAWVEAGIVVGNKLGLDGVRRLHALAAGLQFEIVAFDQHLAEVAVSAHVRFGRGSGHPANLDLGDCFSYALAKSRNLPLLFKGNDFIHTDIVPALGPV